MLYEIDGIPTVIVDSTYSVQFGKDFDLAATGVLEAAAIGFAELKKYLSSIPDGSGIRVLYKRAEGRVQFTLQLFSLNRDNHFEKLLASIMWDGTEDDMVGNLKEPSVIDLTK